MSSIDEAVSAMLARDGIRECLARLARGEDRRDPEMISASLWPESITDYGVFRGTFDQYLAWVVPGSPAITNTQHLLGQSFVSLDGDRARVETQVISYHRVEMGSGERDTCIGGRYLDKFERRNAEWRIAERTMLYDWYQDWGLAVDWANGLMSMPFSAPRFSGRAQGDHSVDFFSA